MNRQDLDRLIEVLMTVRQQLKLDTFLFFNN